MLSSDDPKVVDIILSFKALDYINNLFEKDLVDHKELLWAVSNITAGLSH
jgi:hypothetical protein